ncbi:DUF6000 family protein [Flectobacillus longus]|uniref:DUF6000 family protein n=1 Tax=Flectobacillus longus TaxID=2984207 RepID=UPI0024B74B0D|nr:DUF6000 family protein [Flectobacillus longus]MDI9880314.1 DUF6000 family protein [Flectobacillus longus]
MSELPIKKPLFPEVNIPILEHELSDEVLEKSFPFFDLDFTKLTESDHIALALASKETTEAMAYQLLCNYDWRTRLSGANICAIRCFNGLDVLIGNLLLSNKLVYVGKSYCLALASLDTPNAKNVLSQYLEFHLTPKDCYNDSIDAMCALAYLEPTKIQSLLSQWINFSEDKKLRKLVKAQKHFESCMQHIKDIQDLLLY